MRAPSACENSVFMKAIFLCKWRDNSQIFLLKCLQEIVVINQWHWVGKKEKFLNSKQAQQDILSVRPRKLSEKSTAFRCVSFLERVFLFTWERGENCVSEIDFHFGKFRFLF